MKNTMRLDIGKFALAWGFAFAFIFFIMDMISMIYNPLQDQIYFIGQFYYGYEPTFWGSLAGAVWGFAEGCIVGALVGVFYNLGLGNEVNA